MNQTLNAAIKKCGGLNTKHIWKMSQKENHEVRENIFFSSAIELLKYKVVGK